MHSRWYEEPDGHAFADPRNPGLAPMSQGMREFRKESGYDALLREKKGKPCEVGFTGCTGKVEHLHEPLSRAQAGGLKAALRDGPKPLGACDRCNGAIENTVKGRAWALAHGFKVRRVDLVKGA